MSVLEDEWTDKRMDDLAGRVDRFEGNVKERFDQVDQRFDRFEEDVKERFDRFEGRVDGRFDRFEGDVKDKFAKVETGFTELGAKMDKMTRRLTGGLVTVVGAVIIKVFIS